MRSKRVADVITAIDDASRPIERAALSVLTEAPAGTRLIIVCHEVSSDVIRRRLPGALMDRIEIVSYSDGIASPAGPKNAGLSCSQAEFVSFVDSDDYLRPGALTGWVDLANSAHKPDVVVARLEHQGGGLVRTPPTRWGRQRLRLGFVRDRLFYRSAPLGLIRRSVLTENELQFEPELAIGEDLLLGLRLWSEGRILYAGDTPAYVVGADAAQRASKTPWPVSIELECCTRLVRSSWFDQLNDDQREAVVVKLIRVNLLGAIAKRNALAEWEAEERLALAVSTDTIVGSSATAWEYLSLAEARVVTAALDASVPDSRLRALSDRRLRHGRWDTLVARTPRGMVGRHSAARLMVASALMR